MAVSSLVAASGGKTMYRTTLTSGTSYTVPAGVTYLNVTLVGGGGGGAGISPYSSAGTSGGNGGTTTFTGATSAGGGEGGRNWYPGVALPSYAQSWSGAVSPSGSGKAGTPATSFFGTGFYSDGWVAGYSSGGLATDGSIISTTLSATPGASIAYSIGGGGSGGVGGTSGENGGAGGSGCINIEYWV